MIHTLRIHSHKNSMRFLGLFLRFGNGVSRYDSQFKHLVTRKSPDFARFLGRCTAVNHNQKFGNTESLVPLEKLWKLALFPWTCPFFFMLPRLLNKHLNRHKQVNTHTASSSIHNQVNLPHSLQNQVNFTSSFLFHCSYSSPQAIRLLLDLFDHSISKPTFFIHFTSKTKARPSSPSSHKSTQLQLNISLLCLNPAPAQVSSFSIQAIQLQKRQTPGAARPILNLYFVLTRLHLSLSQP